MAIVPKESDFPNGCLGSIAASQQFSSPAAAFGQKQTLAYEG